jgi:hypothetical protein
MGFSFKEVIIIKCRYKYCKNNNIVDKEIAIKEGSAYYCPQCYKEKQLKQEIEQYYSANLPPTTIQILRKVISQLLYTNNYEAEYILFIVKKIHINKFKINNPFGLVSYCNEGRYITEWNKKKSSQEYNKIKDQINKSIDIEKIDYKYQPNIKKWTDII